MKNDIRSYVSGSKEESAAQKAAQSCVPDGVDPSVYENVQSTIDRYAGRSDDELIGELVRAKNSGAIDTNSIKSVASQITPMLDQSQQARLSEILSKLM